MDNVVGKPDLPCDGAGEPQSADGATRNAPPTPSYLSPRLCTREAARRMRREVDSRKGETPDEIPTPERSGGWGVGVGGRASRPHGDEDPWRRPLACGKTGTPVPSERASCARWMPCMLEKCEGTLHGVRSWRRTAGVEPCEVKASSTVLNGGLRKRACCNAPCPYPTASLRLSAAPEA